MTIYTPYTYLIGWTDHNKWYYGVRYSKKCNPSDLWVKYFTSSSYVHNFRKKHGEPDIVQVRKIFEDEASARLWEMKVLQKMKVLSRDDFLNEAISLAMSTKACSKGGKNSTQKRTKEQKREFGRRAAKARSESMTPDQRRVCGVKGMESRWGSMTPEERSLYTSKRMEKIPLETCTNCGATLRKNQITRFHNDKCKVDTTKTKYPQFSDEWNKINLVSCEYCHMDNITPGNYKRWHGNNCKNSPEFDKNKRKVDKQKYKKCDYCGKIVAPNIFSQFHGDKCRFKS